MEDTREGMAEGPELVGAAVETEAAAVEVEGEAAVGGDRPHEASDEEPRDPPGGEVCSCPLVPVPAEPFITGTVATAPPVKMPRALPAAAVAETGPAPAEVSSSISPLGLL